MDKQRLNEQCTIPIDQDMITEFSLAADQVGQLQIYGSLLIEWNEKFNLTAIVDPQKIARYHFFDSIAIARAIDFDGIAMTADIGTGGGFPGIPLKIMYPHLTMLLIEVNGKKRAFLEWVIQRLGLTNVIIYPHDWRTFLRSTHYPVDYFFARASLQPEELVRIFKPSSVYQQAGLVYWASEQWHAGKQEELFVEREVPYQVAPGVMRKYVFFKKK